LEHNNLLNRLRGFITDNVYTIGHNSSTNPNAVLCIQVSARARALLGIHSINRICLL
jgi:hypothetical protein